MQFRVGFLASSLLMWLGFLAPLYADELPKTHPNPYVDLYLQRVLEAQAKLTQTIALKDLASAKLEMARKLRVTGAISYEEFLENSAGFDVSIAGVEEAKAYISETKALYQLALIRTEAGQDMPICLR